MMGYQRGGKVGVGFWEYGAVAWAGFSLGLDLDLQTALRLGLGLPLLNPGCPW